jgi:Lipoprotein LpqB beta-propeller domain
MPDRHPALSCRPRRWTALVTGLVAAAALAGGCSFIPAGTGPQPASAPAPPPGAGPCCGLLVRGPQPDWNPEDVVKNFLLASAIRANDFQVARQYLTKNANRAWRPRTRVTILTREPRETLLQPHVPGPGTNPTVLVAGQEQAILNDTGQYIPAPGGKPKDQPTEEFALQKVNGVYKIDQLIPPGGHSNVSHELLLTNDLFQLEYTPRNLYYYGRNWNLLPYPVFVPIQGKDPPVTLIDDLIHGPNGWLQGAAQSAFPRGSHLVPPIQVFPGPSGGRTAVVNIAVPRHVQDGQESRMATQLVATLTSPVYSPPLFRAVKIKFNGRPWQPSGHPGSALGLSASQRYIPHLPAGAEAYYLAQGGVLRSLSSGSDRGVVVTRGPGAAQVSLTKIAVSPGGGRLAGLAGPANTVYTGILVTKPGHRQSVEQLQAQLSGTSFSSLSWDNSDNLWVVSTKGHRQGVRVLVTGQGPGLPAHLPDLGGPVTSLRVAPDGVRVAMIVGEGTRAHLVLAAAMRDSGGGFSLTEPAPLFSALPPVSALTWYDEDHLLVITGSGENSQYWEVPVDGYNPTSLVKLPGLTTVTAAGPGHPIYLGLENGGLERATGLNQSLVPITPGQAIIYPG